MLSYAMQHSCPSKLTAFLISSDTDYALMVQNLRAHQTQVVVIIDQPSGALRKAASQIIKWKDLLRSKHLKPTTASTSASTGQRKCVLPVQRTNHSVDTNHEHFDTMTFPSNFSKESETKNELPDQGLQTIEYDSNNTSHVHHYFFPLITLLQKAENKGCSMLERSVVGSELQSTETLLYGKQHAFCNFKAYIREAKRLGLVWAWRDSPNQNWICLNPDWSTNYHKLL
jgi:hypothetical protein